MNKQDLITTIAAAGDLPQAKADTVVDAIFGAIEQALKAGEEVRFVGFGSFAVSTRKAGTGRNPRTDEAMPIPASITVRFRPGRNLRDALN